MSQIFPYTTSCCYNNPKISIRKKKREADGDALRRLPPNTPGNRPLFFPSERDCKGKDYFPFPQYPAQLFFSFTFPSPEAAEHRRVVPQKRVQKYNTLHNYANNQATFFQKKSHAGTNRLYTWRIRTEIFLKGNTGWHTKPAFKARKWLKKGGKRQGTAGGNARGREITGETGTKGVQKTQIKTYKMETCYDIRKKGHNRQAISVT